MAEPVQPDQVVTWDEAGGYYVLPPDEAARFMSLPDGVEVRALPREDLQARMQAILEGADRGYVQRSQPAVDTLKPVGSEVFRWTGTTWRKVRGWNVHPPLPVPEWQPTPDQFLRILRSDFNHPPTAAVGQFGRYHDPITIASASPALAIITPGGQP